MSALIFINAKKMLALIFLVRQKWVGVNILGVSALIFLALVTGQSSDEICFDCENVRFNLCLNLFFKKNW
jgi:hypothetical protein